MKYFIKVFVVSFLIFTMTISGGLFFVTSKISAIPEDIETPSLEMTPDVQAGLDAIIPMVLAELDRLGSVYRERNP